MPAKSVKKTKKAPKKTSTKKKNPDWESRAVLRLIEAGSSVDCAECEEPIKYKARQRDSQVICNIYENSVWQKVEHYHEDCYKKAKKPYGTPAKK